MKQSPGREEREYLVDTRHVVMSSLMEWNVQQTGHCMFESATNIDSDRVVGNASRSDRDRRECGDVVEIIAATKRRSPTPRESPATTSGITTRTASSSARRSRSPRGRGIGADVILARQSAIHILDTECVKWISNTTFDEQQLIPGDDSRFLRAPRWRRARLRRQDDRIASAAACLSENAVRELVAGALAGDALAQAQRHIETCADCGCW